MSDIFIFRILRGPGQIPNMNYIGFNIDNKDCPGPSGPGLKWPVKGGSFFQSIRQRQEFGTFSFLLSSKRTGPYGIGFVHEKQLGRWTTERIEHIANTEYCLI